MGRLWTELQAQLEIYLQFPPPAAQLRYCTTFLVPTDHSPIVTCCSSAPRYLEQHRSGARIRMARCIASIPTEADSKLFIHSITSMELNRLEDLPLSVPRCTEQRIKGDNLATGRSSRSTPMEATSNFCTRSTAAMAINPSAPLQFPGPNSSDRRDMAVRPATVLSSHISFQSHRRLHWRLRAQSASVAAAGDDRSEVDSRAVRNLQTIATR